LGIEEELAANTVEYAVDTAWYVSMWRRWCAKISVCGVGVYLVTK